MAYRTPAVRRRLALAAGVLLPVLLAPSPVGAVDALYCQVMDLSPDYAKDRTAFCAYAAATTLVVHRTTDGGRTWHRADTTVVRLPDRSRTGQLVVSADYPNDRSVFLSTDTTLYVSRDAGATFLPLDRLAGDSSGRRVLSRYLDATAGVAVPYLVLGAYEAPARLSPPFHETVPGALPAYTERFLVPPRVTAASDPLLIAFSGSGGANTWSVYGCTVTLACQDRRADVPGGRPVGAWLSPSYDDDRTLYVVTRENGFTFHRSTDAGRTFRRWTAVNTALAGITKEMVRRGTEPPAPPALAFGPKGRVYLRVVPGFADDGKAPPFQVLLRSDDRGARWRQVASSYDTGGRRRGTMPFSILTNTLAENASYLTVAPDGRVFAMGSTLDDRATGAWCSLDGGVRWYRTCPK